MPSSQEYLARVQAAKERVDEALKGESFEVRMAALVSNTAGTLATVNRNAEDDAKAAAMIARQIREGIPLYRELYRVAGEARECLAEAPRGEWPT